MTKSSPLALTVLSLLHYRPLHPYGVQRLLKEWGKDQVVNVDQRAGLYRTMERLLAAGLIAVRETGRDAQYPERTVYEVTEAGSATAHEWLDAMLATPKQEYPEFPAALSLLTMLAPDAIADALTRRAAALEAAVAAHKKTDGLPRILTMDSDYLLAITTAELTWVRGALADLAAGRLAWTEDELAALAGDQGE
ncbi:PadR family transcriptional regulator [Kutzneria buriramensis]|uniref:PadR family transcriptional regulator n=1 Tax=Kutzneria buriramensis TaxID=1045776 RepID=A0A3E0HI74_9PSEU|nr:PadR family transcriptional regulator [Kutzneria buriramensis]REH45906.1 PadR family transcriptional regulator [Kutzneria buriramensis]